MEARKCVCINPYSDDDYVFNIHQRYEYFTFFCPGFESVIKVSTVDKFWERYSRTFSRTFSLADFDKYFVDITEYRNIRINEILKD